MCVFVCVSCSVNNEKQVGILGRVQVSFVSDSVKVDFKFLTFSLSSSSGYQQNFITMKITCCAHAFYLIYNKKCAIFTMVIKSLKYGVCFRRVCGEQLETAAL